MTETRCGHPTEENVTVDVGCLTCTLPAGHLGGCHTTAAAIVYLIDPLHMCEMEECLEHAVLDGPLCLPHLGMAMTNSHRILDELDEPRPRWVFLKETLALLVGVAGLLFLFSVLAR